MQSFTPDDEDYSVESDSGDSKKSSSDTTDLSSDKNVVRPALASSETRAVTWSKVLMVSVLLAVATVAAVSTYKYTTRQEEENFETRFTDFANQIIGVYQVNANQIYETYQNFALQYSSFASGAQLSWPFVTLPAFEAQATSVNIQTGARTMAVAHLVRPEERYAWQNYTLRNPDWKQEGFVYQGMNVAAGPVAPFIWGSFREFAPIGEPLGEYYAPYWQGAPIIDNDSISNFDAFRQGTFFSSFDRMYKTNSPVLSEVRNLDDNDFEKDAWGSFWPESVMVVPIYEGVEKTHETSTTIAAVITSILPWHNYFIDLLPQGIDGIILVMSNTCEQEFSYTINGPNVTYLGVGDRHDKKYDDLVVSTAFTPFASEMECLHTLSLYPSREFESKYESNKPVFYMLVVMAMFIFTAGVFFVYDCFVERRQDKVMTTATRSTAIVSSLFPARVADRLMQDAAAKDSKKKERQGKTLMMGKAATGMNMTQLDDMTDHQHAPLHTDSRYSKPIAELFPSATVLFADIVGFTAWSSVREPSHVFELLEQIYSSFDKIGKRKKVFKVETIGDCYVAATGLPEVRSDHAILMARFARDCLRKMLHVVRRLEVRLGPETGELGLRIGIHTGPVTAGVLRGEKARFQLFGDTVNTAARMESTGSKNKIQVSAETAELIQKAGYNDIWVVPREEVVEAKGKGELQTFWLRCTSQGTGTVSSVGTNSLDIPSIDRSDSDGEGSVAEIAADSKQNKLNRSIDWSVDVLQRQLKKIVALRGLTTVDVSQVKMAMPATQASLTPLDEVKDIITLPSEAASYPIDPSSVELPPEVIFELRDYVKAIASLYRGNKFHCFEHATHVTQSVTKLLARVVTPNVSEFDEQVLHKYTYGITSDPLTQFAVAFSALIHDVDHPGVPNATLVKEKTDTALLYSNKSVAEQNSVDIAWDLLAEPCYANLRACIYTTQSEYQRFRQLVVNSVMATDIVDKELGAARKTRWEKAFNSPEASSRGPSSTMDANRKATIVIEHLIQASDVSHTMQHWHIYVRWNEHFFIECYKGYLEGRTDTDPSEGWYEGELGFFDFYIIPLAKKLKECGVFGVASDEYLQYAQANRREWETKGKDLVEGYLSKYQKKNGNSVDVV